MKKIFLVGILFITMPVMLFSQFSLCGRVIHKETRESLRGAHIVIEKLFLSRATDQDGAFIFENLREGVYTVKITYVGFATEKIQIHLTQDEIISIELEPRVYMSDEVLIIATKVPQNSPTTFKNLTKEEIENTNLGQDLPILLDMLPSTVTTSDAGAGIGYTGLRIRGTDMTRINVTLNGIPLNDAESHGVFWVNMPDFASSVDNIQIQRGVGTSTNGAAAFGASINLQTAILAEKPYAEVNHNYGSYNTFKNSIQFGTGLMNGRFTFNGRLSKITSDGYIDRAFSDLKSFFVSGAYYGKNSILKANIFSGREKTYQAWNGVPKVRLKNDTEGMQRYEGHWLYSHEETLHMMASNNRTYNFYTYENEIDHYQQDHYQLLFTQKINPLFHFNVALHYTHGEGYYEQYKTDRNFEDYLIPPLVIGGTTITETDLIQRKWLDNDFYGFTYSLKYEKDKLNIIFGGAWNKYIGDHFGEVIWSEYAVDINKNYRWYENTGTKTDFNIFGKLNYQLFEKINIYGDLQYRFIDFEIDGIHDDLRDISQIRKFNFFNPKVGVFYFIDAENSAYASLAVANREPSRTNYRDADENNVPKKELLIDYELGYKFHGKKIAVELNGFFMDYKDQLVLTGEINNVGAPNMTNVPNSYRLGVEIAGIIQVNHALKWEFNTTFSNNKIRNFTAFIDNWDLGGTVEENFLKTDLSFSPNLILGNIISLTPIDQWSISLISKYVSRQYIDNTSSINRSLDPYFVNNVNICYQFKTKFIPEIAVKILLNNIFNEQYETNAWVYRYHYLGADYEMDGYFPQAGINVLFGISFIF